MVYRKEENEGRLSDFLDKLSKRNFSDEHSYDMSDIIDGMNSKDKVEADYRPINLRGSYSEDRRDSRKEDYREKVRTLLNEEMTEEYRVDNVLEETKKSLDRAIDVFMDKYKED